MLQGLGSTWFNYTTNMGNGHLSNIPAFSYHSNFAWVLQGGLTVWISASKLITCSWL